MNDNQADLLRGLVETSYAIAKSKGWWDKPRTYAALTLLMQSEISEALEDYRAGKGIDEVWYEHKGVTQPLINHSPKHRDELGKPCGIPSELADVVIRIADFCGHEDLRLLPVEGLVLRDFDVSLALANREISQAFMLLWEGPPSILSVEQHLSTAVQYLVNVCDQNKIDLWKVIADKAEYNKTRSQRHGGKAI